ATVDLGMHRYSSEKGEAFYRDALERVRAIPGVSSAALVERLPFSPNIHADTIFIDGRAYSASDRGALVDVTHVGTRYFDTLGVPILRGRPFDGRDTPGSTPVAIVNRAMAQRYWPGEDPIGKRIHSERPDGPAFEVVGVAADHKVRTVDEGP